MTTITTKIYHFRKPSKISEYEYERLKFSLWNDPNFSLVDPDEAITKEYGLLFKHIIWASILLVFAILISAIFEKWRY